jgi:hypothetical protein
MSELRAEARIKSRGRFEILVDGREPIVATVYDVSPSGLCLDSDAGVERGSRIQLDGYGIIADGVVRYCAQVGNIYRIGVELCSPETA